MRRPSPRRRTFSKDPSWEDIVGPRVPARLRPSCGPQAVPISIPAMGRIRGPIGVAALALAFLCGCGHGNSASGASWVVFASDRDGRWDVYAVHPDGTGLIRVTARRTGTSPHLAASPDGDWLAIVASDRGVFRVAPAGGGPARRLARGATGPAWSPDGRWLAFSVPVGGPEYEP